MRNSSKDVPFLRTTLGCRPSFGRLWEQPHQSCRIYHGVVVGGGRLEKTDEGRCLQVKNGVFDA
jgi:hypothetical protein